MAGGNGTRSPGVKRPDPIDVAVGDRIRKRRDSLGISGGKLGDSLGISYQQVQKYENGSNRISASRLVKTAKLLKTTVAELVGETLVVDPLMEAVRTDDTVRELVEAYMDASAVNQQRLVGAFRVIHSFKASGG